MTHSLPEETLSQREIGQMFNRISPFYDRINHLLSLGIDRYWRKKVFAYFPKKKNLHYLDCATGTADQLIEMMDQGKTLIAEATGIDLAENMLQIAEEKIRHKSYANKIVLIQADISALPYLDSTFDVITLSFGIRNVVDVSSCLKELYRVLKPEGRLLLLEFSLPTHFLIKKLYLAYLRYILPKVGGWLSQVPQAFRYLNKTIEKFPYGTAFCTLLQEAGFSQVKAHPLTGGIVALYEGEK